MVATQDSQLYSASGAQPTRGTIGSVLSWLGDDTNISPINQPREQVHMVERGSERSIPIYSSASPCENLGNVLHSQPLKASMQLVVCT